MILESCLPSKLSILFKCMAQAKYDTSKYPDIRLPKYHNIQVLKTISIPTIVFWQSMLLILSEPHISMVSCKEQKFN